MFILSYPNKQNTITDVSIDGSSKTGSNSGRSEILEAFVLTSSVSDRGISRFLLQFDLTVLSQSIASSFVPTASVKYRLKLKNAAHAETLPSSFDLFVYAASQSWDQGVGLSMHDEGRKDGGYSNWSYAKSTVRWANSGSDFILGLSASQHFDSGEEDLDIDISNIVYAWLTGGVANNGLVVKFDDIYETGSADFYVKKFYSGRTHIAERHPQIHALWDNAIQDDRGNFHYGVSGSLYYYHVVNKTPISIGSSLFVNILNSSSTVVQTLTASQVSNGIYYASGVLVSKTSSTTVFRDVWFTGVTQYFTGSFTPNFATGSSFLGFGDIDASLLNLKEKYDDNEQVYLRFFIHALDYAPAIHKSGSLKVYPECLSEAYISIENEETQEILVPFSTGSNKFGRLSYDENGNYCYVWSNSFPKNNVYRIKLLANYNNQQYIFDKGWIFKR